MTRLTISIQSDESLRIALRIRSHTWRDVARMDLSTTIKEAENKDLGHLRASTKSATDIEDAFLLFLGNRMHALI